MMPAYHDVGVTFLSDCSASSYMESTESPTMTTHSRPKTNRSSIVENGYDRAWAAIEAEVRREVEARYAPEWTTFGLLQRWRLRRRMKREIKEHVRERMNQISACSLF